MGAKRKIVLRLQKVRRDIKEEIRGMDGCENIKA